MSPVVCLVATQMSFRPVTTSPETSDLARLIIDLQKINAMTKVKLTEALSKVTALERKLDLRESELRRIRQEHPIGYNRFVPPGDENGNSGTV